MESRCRSAVMDKEKLEEYLTELEREKKSNEKKTAKVSKSHLILRVCVAVSMYSLQLQAKVSKLTAELKEEKEVCFVEEEGSGGQFVLFLFADE